MDEQQEKPLPGGAPGPQAEPAGEAIRELALRLLAFPFPGGPDPGQAELVVGKLAASLPIELPLPPAARVLGTFTRTPHWSTVVLDVELSPQEVLAYYRQQLLPAGWSEPDDPLRHAGGFAAGMPYQANRVLFCRSARGPALTVQATGRQQAPTDVRLELQSDPRQSPCAPQRRFPGPAQVLPPLLAPPNARQTGLGGSSGPDQAQSTAILATDLDLASLARHYEQQLEGAGWERTDAGCSDPTAWSTWTFAAADGEAWRGLLTVLRRPDLPGRYLLLLQAELRDGEPLGGGGSYGVLSTGYL